MSYGVVRLLRERNDSLAALEIYTEVGLPDGVFNVVQGDARQYGHAGSRRLLARRGRPFVF